MNKKYNSNRIVKEAYDNLEQYVDSFNIIEDLQTDLLYGELIEKNRDILLTLIIPTYNRDVLLKEAVNSVLNQKPVDYNWEFIIIDNTGLDENQETPALNIVREIGNNKILYYHNRVNIGSGYNWNRGVQLARGRWICFLHDDDVLCSDALINIGKMLNKYRNLNRPLGYIHAKMLSFNEDFNEDATRLHNLPFEIELTQNTTLLLGNTYTGMPTCGTTILKKAYVEVGGINYDFGPTADAVLGYLIMRKYTVLRSGRILGGYRWSNNETLKVSTLEKLLESDLLFATYRYKKNLLGKIWGKVFGNNEAYNNYLSKLAILQKNRSIECSSFNFKGNKPNLLHQKLYKIVVLFIKMLICIKGILFFANTSNMNFCKR